MDNCECGAKYVTSTHLGTVLHFGCKRRQRQEGTEWVWENPSYECYRRQVASLQTVLNKLRRTEDDMPVVPGMPLWQRTMAGSPHQEIIVRERVATASHEAAGSPVVPRPYADCYSTRAAAEEADNG
jgi:hypothetical protein